MNCRKTLFAGIVVIGILISAATQGRAAERLEVRHGPLLCVPREKPFELHFKILSDDPIQEARVYFRKQEAEHFYFTLAQAGDDGELFAILPGPHADVSVLEYLLLVVDANETVVKSPTFALVADEEQACEENRVEVLPEEIIVSSDWAIEAEIGFSGEYIVWELPETIDDETPFLREAAEQLNVSDMMLADPQEDVKSKGVDEAAKPSAKRGMSKKAMVGIGAAGAGALALVGVVASGGSDGDGGGGIWDGIGDVTDQVLSVLYKTPAVQNVCGTRVTNQLSVTNNASEVIRLGTIDYEIILTTDSPAGSCQPGRSGSFAPSSKTVLDPGETVLVREWVNDVNPCSGCPYLSAECVWESRYLVHTSLGSSVTMSSFSAEGDLCGGAAGTKAFENRQQPCGDDAP